ncbi:MAG: AmmeMemoRadiSam system protein B [Bacteroidetes bacterium]|nr:AmmeMemoRadiSam system protein B [Bacteroidota bacterium]
MPYGPVKVSGLRESVISGMNSDYYIVHDSVQSAEHSVEAIIPFLQYYDRDVQIISILVPYMPYERMRGISENLSDAIYKAVSANNLEWGKDFAVIISNDAVHYGDEEWGGNNYAPYGSDSSGYRLAVAHEHEIIDNCLTGNITAGKIKKFTEYTVSEENYRDYKWTWCGRYSVPFGLLTVLNLQKSFGENLSGYLLKYATSIDHPHVPVKDSGMGTTAPAYLRHWVGYAAIGYR